MAQYRSIEPRIYLTAAGARLPVDIEATAVANEVQLGTKLNLPSGEIRKLWIAFPRATGVVGDSIELVSQENIRYQIKVR